MTAPLDPDKARRLDALNNYQILDTPAEQAYDDIVRLAATICDVPIALVSLLDSDRQWFKARIGLDALQTPIGDAFCAHAILCNDPVMEVPDAMLDPRFSANPLVLGEPNIRFYAGAPLVTAQGVKLGTVCVIDRVPRKLDARSHDALAALSRQVVALLELRHSEADLKELADLLHKEQADLKQLNQFLLNKTVMDSLTGLKNRRGFDALLQNETSRAARSGQPTTLLFIDVDHFKSLNDDFGHVAGDEALRQIATLLTQKARPYDHVARYGGEEMAVILPETDLPSGVAVAQRIRLAIQNFAWPHRAITVSIGVAQAANAEESATMIERADKAMYRAKSQGRNQVCTPD